MNYETWKSAGREVALNTEACHWIFRKCKSARPSPERGTPALLSWVCSRGQALQCSSSLYYFPKPAFPCCCFVFFFNYYPLRQSPVPLSCLPGLPRSLPRYQRLFLLMPWFQGCNHSEWSPINPAFSIRLARRSVHSCRNSNLYWKPHVHQYVSLCHSLSSRYTNVYSTGLSWCTLRLCPNTCLQKRGCH